MPFPLAHPAAVLPLRRWCPRYFNFPALVIGSVSPDAGYFVGAGEFSHRFLAGTFGFCLPAGLIGVLLFYGGRRTVAGILPETYRRALLPLCQRRAGNPLLIVISLLVGAWTHVLLDAFTHPDEWLVKYLPALLDPVLTVGRQRFMLCEILYAGLTFAGVAWLAFCYLRWLEEMAANPSTSIPPGVKWVGALLLAGAICFPALAFRRPHQMIGIVPAGFLAGPGRAWVYPDNRLALQPESATGMMDNSMRPQARR